MKELYIFVQSVRYTIFKQIELKVSQARDKKDRVGVVKNMNPILPFVAMATDMITGKTMVAHIKTALHNASGAEPCVLTIIDSRHKLRAQGTQPVAKVQHPLPRIGASHLHPQAKCKSPKGRISLHFLKI
jgi:hypothetical protein